MWDGNVYIRLYRDMTQKTYLVKDMHCTSCAVVIEGELEDIGVKASCDYVSCNLTVEFDEKKIKEEQIIEVVSKEGYTLLAPELV